MAGVKRFGVGATVLPLMLAGVATAQDRAVLPPPEPPFAGVIEETLEASRSAPMPRLAAPQMAPNIVLFMSDDVGFAMASAFGGPVPTPNFDRLAARGARYNRFHTTGICSPSRAALLTGRNHHNAATGMLADMPSDFPGYTTRIPRSTATIAEVLRLNGYSTAMFGKHHNVPPDEASAAGPFDHWPTGLGFEYFYGFVTGDTDQWRPKLVRGTDPLPDAPMGELVDSRVAGDAIRWLHNQKLAAPGKPFFIYLAPGSTHAPHQAPAEWIARFAGRFDRGWDAMRVEIWRRQLAMGIVPRGTRLTPRPDGIPAWDSMNPVQKRFATRAMEVAAGMLAYQDAQLGRLLDEIERMGLANNTLVLTVLGDNGASGEGGPAGVINELASANGIRTSDAALEATYGKLGGPQATANYPVGWAWAMNTPLRWTKQYTSMLGGIRNGMIMAWGKRAAKPGAVCAEFGHLVDVAPTLYEAAGVPAPGTVHGVAQKPLDGASLLASLGDCQPGRPRTQYFELQGKAGLWRNGWFASSDNGRRPWELSTSVEPLSTWELYNVDKDFSQSEDLSAKHPQLLSEMIGEWREQAVRNHVFPIMSSRMASVQGGAAPAKRKSYEFWGKDTAISAHPDGLGAPASLAGSFTLRADLRLARAEASGVVAAVGSDAGGWSLYLDRGRPVFAYARSPLPGDLTRVTTSAVLPAGAAALSLNFRSEGSGKGANVELRSGDRLLATGRVDKVWNLPLSVGELLEAGRDSGVPVTDYATPGGALEGDISHMVLTFP